MFKYVLAAITAIGVLSRGKNALRQSLQSRGNPVGE